MLILDTDAYSAYRRNEARITEPVQGAEALGFSAIVLGELLSGFRTGSRYEDNILHLEKFLSQSRVKVLPVAAATAGWFSKISSSLKKKGKPIPSNDIWIAAQAMETGSDLISFDKHYGEIEGLRWVRP